MEEQYALVESMNGALLAADEEMRCNHATYKAAQRKRTNHVWDIYKGGGDGAIFAFGEGLNPISVQSALAYAAHAMAAFHQHNAQLPAGALNVLSARMAIAYGRIYPTKDLNGDNDILGDAINVCARLVSSKRAISGAILVENTIYHNTMINSKIYYKNEDGSLPTSGMLSDFALGCAPDGDNFLYFQDDGVHETKDRLLHAYNLSGRLGGIDIQRTY